MNLIDAVEGSFKAVITRLFKLYCSRAMDDTEYIQGVRAVIQAAEDFLTQQADVLHDRRILIDILYDFARKPWLEMVLAQQQEEQAPPTKSQQENMSGYFEYYYDYIYVREHYPV